MSDEGLNGHVHKVSHYFNKRFFKYTEEGREYHADLALSDVQEEGARSLFVSEGNLLPSKTELSLARKAKFELYTITNLSFMDLAASLSIKPNLYAVSKRDLGNRDEVVESFSQHSAASH